MIELAHYQEQPTFNATAFSRVESSNFLEESITEYQPSSVVIPLGIHVLVERSALSTLETHQRVATRDGLVDGDTVAQVSLTRLLALAQLVELAQEWETKNQFVSRVSSAFDDYEATELAAHGEDSMRLALDRLDTDAAPLWIAFLERLGINADVEQASSIDDAVNSWKAWGRSRQREQW